MSETKQAVQAGVTDYDAVITAIANGCAMGAGNFVLDLTQVPYIDLKQSWWDQGIIRDVTINDRTYIATGARCPDSCCSRESSSRGTAAP